MFAAGNRIRRTARCPHAWGSAQALLTHSHPCSDVLIYISGCKFSPEVLKHKVFPSPAALLLPTAGEHILETEADNREVDYSELLVNLKARVCTARSIPQFLQHFPTSQGHRKKWNDLSALWFSECQTVLELKQWKYCTGLLLWAAFQYSVSITKSSFLGPLPCLLSGNHGSVHRLPWNILQITGNPKYHSEIAWPDFWITATSFTGSWEW